MKTLKFALLSAVSIMALGTTQCGGERRPTSVAMVSISEVTSSRVPVVGAAAAVPNQVGLGADGPVGVGRDGVPGADVGRRDLQGGAEGSGPEAVRGAACP